MTLGVTHHDWSELLLVALSEQCGIEGHCLGQMRYVPTVESEVSLQFTQSQVMSLEREQAKIRKPAWEELDEAIGIRLGRSDDPDVMKAEAVLLGKRRASTGYLLKNLHSLGRPDLDVIHVASPARQAVMHRNDEASEAVNLDGSGQLTVHY